MPSPTPPYPPGFVWGAATASYQIEGAVHADGRGESIWDRFCRQPGKIADGSNGDVACDHYHRWRGDVALMRGLGLNAYRFSIAWPRILPQGRGRPNPAGLDFYERLVDGLLAAGLAPYATLYHWDLPQPLQDAGGWPGRDTAHAFADYAELVVRRLGDRVAAWATINEPWCVAFLGHLTGEHAPGGRDMAAALRAVHHVLLAHGLAVPAIRDGARGAPVGIVLNPTVVEPASGKAADEDTARLVDAFRNRIFLDPLCRGTYPQEFTGPELGQLLPIQAGDMAQIAAPLDYLGINFYNRDVVAHDPNAPWPHQRGVPVAGAEYTEMGWEVHPAALRGLLEQLHRDYPFPAYYVTENGAAFDDQVRPDGTVQDSRRIAYLEGHLGACAAAIAAGVPLRGYFVWSLMDNFEWGQGYTKRFGIVYVDYATQQRIPKASALWYRDFIARQG